MANSTGADSTLGAIASKRARVQQIRQRLSMNDQPGAAQGGMKPNAPQNPSGPAAGGDEAFDIDSAMQKFDAKKGEMLEMIRSKLPQFAQQDSGGGLTVAPEQPGAVFSNPYQTMQGEGTSLLERIRKQSMERASPVEQFTRLAGRMPSPRELAVFNSRSVLESQLGRPPTSNELKMYLLRPEESAQTFQRAFEG